MKALSKVAALIAIVPAAGLISLGNAGSVFASCTDTVIKGVTVCVPNNDGGASGGGTGTIGGGGSGVPGQAGTIAPGTSGGYQQPAPYSPPAPAPLPAAPAPAPAPAPVQQLPAPANNYVQTPSAPIPAPNTVNSVPSGSVSQGQVVSVPAEATIAEVPQASETDPVSENNESVNSAKPLDESPVSTPTESSNAISSESASPSASPQPSQEARIDTKQVSDTQTASSVLAGIIIAVIGAALISIFTLRVRRARTKADQL